MSELTIDYILNHLNPCNDGAEWLRTQPDIATAWKTCHRSDWMLWLCEEAELLNDEQDLALQLAMLDTPLADGRCVLDLITDQRSLAFIQMKHQRLAGKVIRAAAWAAARAAAWDAGDTARAAAWDAAGDTARAAAWAAARAAAWHTARAAAWAAANTAARAAANTAGDAARAAACADVLAWQADKIRKIVCNPFSPQNDSYQEIR